MGDLYLRHEYAFASSQLVLAMMGMGATLRRADFAGLVRAPRGVFGGLALQLLLAPLLGALLIALLRPEPGIAVGLALLAAIPGGSLSNLFAYLARANVALSITLTAITTLACLVTTPIVLGLLASAHLDPDFQMPAGRIAFEIAFCLLGPLGVGMGVGATLSRHRDAFSRWCIRGSLLVIAAMVVGSIAADRVDPVAHGWEALAGMALFAFGLQALSLGVGRALRLAPRDRVALAVEVTIRNTNLGLLIKASILPVRPGVPDPVADGAFFMAIFYGGIAMAAAAIPVLGGRRMLSGEGR